MGKLVLKAGVEAEKEGRAWNKRKVATAPAKRAQHNTSLPCCFPTSAVQLPFDTLQLFGFTITLGRAHLCIYRHKLLWQPMWHKHSSSINAVPCP